jgi:hypothetical protein
VAYERIKRSQGLVIAMSAVGRRLVAGVAPAPAAGASQLPAVAAFDCIDKGWLRRRGGATVAVRFCVAVGSRSGGRAVYACVRKA